MRCPGQDTQYWEPDAVFEVKCPVCSSDIEFFKDDPYRTCRACGHEMINPKMDFGCAAYCKFAEQCIGVQLQSRFFEGGNIHESCKKDHSD
jgi:hypothetical protein